MGRYQSDEEVTALASGGDATTEQSADEEPTEEPVEGEPEGEAAEEAPEGEEEEPEEQEGEDEEEDPQVAITVDGQEVEVPLSELRKGYLRTADYTRKTQQLAQLRRTTAEAEALRQALERNPQETLKVLARHYQVDEFEPDESSGPTPEQVRLMELEQKWQTLEQRQQESAVDAEISRLHAEYGEFDDDALFQFAVDRQVRDLEVALRAMQFGKPAQERRVEKRKTAAIAGGQGRNGAAHPKTPAARITKFDDAYQAALRELQIGN